MERTLGLHIAAAISETCRSPKNKLPITYENRRLTPPAAADGRAMADFAPGGRRKVSEPLETYPSDFEGIPRTRLAAYVLMTVAGLIAILSLLEAGWQISALSNARGDGAGGSAAAISYLTTLRALALWLGAAGLLWGLAEILRRVDESPLSFRDYAPRGNGGAGIPGWAARAEEAEMQRAALTEIAVLLREVRDISLLGQEERAIRLKAQSDEALQELERAVPELLRGHNWVEARRRVQVARERFPGLRDWTELEQRIDEFRASVESHDVETTRRQVNDLAALGAWERAFDVVRELQERHPGSVAARELLQMVQNERGKADAEARSRLMAQVQDAVKRREWSVALSSAQALMRQYPSSSEARALRLDLPTLTENAEIQARKRMEAEITQLTRSRRFDDALQMARELIERYPRSPQATILRERLPQLEARASARTI